MNLLDVLFVSTPIGWIIAAGLLLYGAIKLSTRL